MEGPTMCARVLITGLTALALALSPAWAGPKGGGGNKSSEAPKSSTSLNYQKIEWSYSKQKSSGKNAGSEAQRKYDLKANKKF
jgi:hypothetical protein